MMVVTLVFPEFVELLLVVLDVLEFLALVLQLVLDLQLVVIANLLVEQALQLVLDKSHSLGVVLTVLECVV